jgi:hypothetical protein
MMPWGISALSNFALICAMISRRCASTNTFLPVTRTTSVIMAAPITDFPEPVGATAMMRRRPRSTSARYLPITSI